MIPCLTRRREDAKEGTIEIFPSRLRANPPGADFLPSLVYLQENFSPLVFTFAISKPMIYCDCRGLPADAACTKTEVSDWCEDWNLTVVCHCLLVGSVFLAIRSDTANK